MTFLNALLLGGTAAGMVPIAIHLLHRRKRNVVRWGAMQFLVSKTVTQRRRIKIEQWLLLLLRICVPVLLALCMARPLLSSLHPAQSKTPESLVLLLDDSASMSSEPSKTTPFLKATHAAEFLVQHLPRGSEISILPLSNPDMPLVERSVDLKGATKVLRTHTPRPMPALLAGGLETGATLLAKAHHARRRIVVLTDFQKSNWSRDHLQACDQALVRLRGQKHAPSLSLYDAGVPHAENTAVESLAFSKIPSGPDQKIRFTAIIRNFGSSSPSPKTVAWKVDGAPLSSKTISLGAHESTQVSIEHAFKEAGTHIVEVHIDRDAYPFDDTFVASVPVYTPIPALAVNGFPSPEPMQGETDFLALALQPKSLAHTATGSVLRPATIEPGALSAKLLAQNRVAVLADVRALTRPQVQDLENFVRTGGGLLVFPGRQTDVDWYNKVLHAEGRGLLPARIEALRSLPAGGGPQSIGISQTLSSHPVLEPFTREHSSFDEVKIRQWYSLKPSDPETGPEKKTSPTTLLSMENGEPLFIEHPFGMGTVIQSAIPCSAAWSNLPTRPVYVPLLQRLALHSAIAAEAPLTITAGQPLVASMASNLANQPVSLTTPEAKTTQSLPRQEAGRTIAEFFGTQVPGIYRLNMPDGETRPYAVNASREESDPTRLEEPELEAVALSLQAKIARSEKELLARPESDEEGLEIWRPLLWVILALLFAEIFLMQRFGTEGRVRQ